MLDPHLPVSRPASLTRKITTEYLRLGNVLLGKHSAEFEASAAAVTSGEDDEEGQQGGPRSSSLSVSTLAFAQVDRKERHRRVFSEEVVGVGRGVKAERRKHNSVGAGGGAEEYRTQVDEIVTEREGGGEEEKKGIEMQAVLQRPDDARETGNFVGGGDASGVVEGGGRERAPRGSAAGLSRSLSGDGESPSSRGSASSLGRHHRQKLSNAHAERYAERYADGMCSVLQEDAKMASPSLSSGSSKNLSAGKFGGAGPPSEVVRSPQKYTLRGRGGGTSSDEDRTSPVILPRDSWGAGERVVGSIGDGPDDPGNGRQDDEDSREDEAESQARKLAVDGDDEELWAADDSR